MFKSLKFHISAVLLMLVAAAVIGCAKPSPDLIPDAPTTTEMSTVEATAEEPAEQKPAPEEATAPAQ